MQRTSSPWQTLRSSSPACTGGSRVRHPLLPAPGGRATTHQPGADPAEWPICHSGTAGAANGDRMLERLDLARQRIMLCVNASRSNSTLNASICSLRRHGRISRKSALPCTSLARNSV